MITGRFKTIAFDENGELVQTAEERKAKAKAIAAVKRAEEAKERKEIAKAAAAASATQVHMANRRFVMPGRTGVNKEWNISVIGTNASVRWGREGATLQEKLHGFPTTPSAVDFANAIIAQKVNKGYKEV